MSKAHATDSSRFIIGEVYFCAYFADDDLLYPFIGSFVHVGNNLFGNEQESTWYFQDCESFATHGSFLSGTEADRQILGLTQDGASNMVILDQLIPELRRAEARRQTSR